jgi:hypothetical protein
LRSIEVTSTSGDRIDKGIGEVMKLDKLSFAKNDILFGHDDTRGIVAMELEGDGRG